MRQIFKKNNQPVTVFTKRNKPMTKTLNIPKFEYSVTFWKDISKRNNIFVEANSLSIFGSFGSLHVLHFLTCMYWIKMNFDDARKIIEIVSFGEKTVAVNSWTVFDNNDLYLRYTFRFFMLCIIHIFNLLNWTWIIMLKHNST